jgi:hypothetical protein
MPDTCGTLLIIATVSNSLNVGTAAALNADWGNIRRFELYPTTHFGKSQPKWKKGPDSAQT